MDRKMTEGAVPIILSLNLKGCLKFARTRGGGECNGDHQVLTAAIKF